MVLVLYLLPLMVVLYLLQVMVVLYPLLVMVSKHVADDKKKVIVKAAPSSAQKALADLRPFLRFADGKDSDVEATKPKAAALPRASSRAPSLSRSRSKSKQEKE